MITPSKKSASVSLYTIIHNLSLTLLGLKLDDFKSEDKYLSLTSEQCYHIRLVVRRMTYLFKHYHYPIDYPLGHLDKQILIRLMNSIVFANRTYETLKYLLDSYMEYVHCFTQAKIKRLLHDLLVNDAFEIHSIETIGRFIEMNRFQAKILTTENKTHSVEELWLNDEQMRLVMHRLYSYRIYNDVLIPMINGDCQEGRTMNDILVYLDENGDEQVIDIQAMQKQWTIVP